MRFTTQQVAEKFGYSDSQVKSLVKRGILIPCNKPAEGKTRVNFLFEHAEVNRVRAELPVRVSRKQNKVSVPTSNAPSIGTGLNSRLDIIESKLDQLLKIWD